MEPTEAGERVDARYELRRELGRGGICTVYEALHAYTGRRVAVKLLNPEYAGNPDARTRLLREARALGALRHPNVIDILDAGLSGDRPYVVTELLEGRTLEGLLAARQRLPVADAVAVVSQVLDGLSAAHAVGVVHRDVKPSNVLLVRGPTGDDLVRLLDFGIARVPPEPGAAKLTAVETVLGTPEYMAPEQLLGRGDIDARADVYAAGVTLYECLAGTVPRVGTFQEVLVSLATAPTPPSVRSVRPEVPAALAAVIDRCLARDPTARYADGADMGRALAATALGARHTRLMENIVPDARAGDDTGAARRRYPRAPYSTPVRLVLEGGVVDGRAEDISVGGMLVITPGAVPVGAAAQVRFALPTTGAMVTCAAEVRWVRQKAGRAGGARAVGVEFVAPDDEVRAQLARYVALMGAP